MISGMGLRWAVYGGLARLQRGRLYMSHWAYKPSPFVTAGLTGIPARQAQTLRSLLVLRSPFSRGSHRSKSTVPHVAPHPGKAVVGSHRTTACVYRVVGRCGGRGVVGWMGGAPRAERVESASARRLASGCGDLAARPESATTTPPGCRCASGVCHQAQPTTHLI